MCISVVLPAFNAGATLEQTLAKLESQTYGHWQLVAVDDGSCDATPSLLHRFDRHRPAQTRILTHQTNRGLAQARNTALAHATGQWVAFLDADDLWEPEHLESCVQCLQQVETGWVFAAAAVFGDMPDNELPHRAPRGDEMRRLPQSLFCRNFILPSATVIRRDYLQVLDGFDPALAACEDWDLWLRCLRQGYQPHYTGLQTVGYRKHNRALTANIRLMAESRLQLYRKHADWADIPRWLRFLQRWKARAALRETRRTETGRRP